MSAPRPVREVARLLGVSHQAVLAAVERGRLGASVARDAGGRLLGLRWPAAREEWERNRQQPAPEQRRPSPVADAALDAKLWKLRLLELEYRQRAAQLVDAGEVEALVVKVVAACRERVLAVVGAARGALPHLAARDLAVVDTLLREALEELDALERSK